MRFVDTNVLLYAVSTAPRDRDKARAAIRLLDDRDLALSVQVLQEFYVQATRASRPDPLRHEQAIALIAAWRRYPVGPITVSLLEAALAASARYKIAYWDAAIIESARELGCEIVLSEDLADGRNYDGVRVQNPFR